MLDAQYFGVAQRRRRVFLVADARGGAGPIAVLFEPSCCEGNLAPRDPSAAIATGEIARSVAATGGGNDYGANKGTLIAGPLGAPTKGAGHRADLETSGAFVVEETAGTLTSKQGGSRSTDLDGHGAYVVEEETSKALGASGNHQDPSHESFVFETRIARNGRGAPSDVVPALKAESGRTGKGDSAPMVVAFTTKDFGQDATEDLSPTLRGMQHDKGAPNGGGQVGVAYVISPEGGQGADLAARETELASGLSSTDAKMHDRGTRVLSYRKSQRAHNPEDGESWLEDDTANTLDAGGHAPRTSQAIVTAEVAVRRLTPLECERLQGFPDGWTALKGMTDSARYRMLGNAEAVPVVEWISRRLVEEVERERG